GCARLYCLGAELGRLEFVHHFLRDRTLDLLSRNRQWNGGTCAAAGVRQPAVYVIRAGGRNLGSVHGNQLCFHAGENDRLLGIVGDDDEYGQQSLLMVINRKDLGLVGHVVRINCDRDSFISMRIMRRITGGRLGDRLYEFLRSEDEDRSKCREQEDVCNTTKK